MTTSGDLFAADIGQAAVEEINLEETVWMGYHQRRSVRG